MNKKLISKIVKKIGKIILLFAGIIIFLILIEPFLFSYMVRQRREEVRQKYEELVKIGKLDIPQEGIEAVEFRHRDVVFFIYFYPNDPDRIELRYFATPRGEWRDMQTGEWIKE